MTDVPDRPSGVGIDTADGRDEWWPMQQETIQKIVDAFEQDGKRFVLADMPTGAGKTIVATAVQRLLDLSAVNLTHTIQLQGQYAQTLPWASVVTGRRNHRCDLAPDTLGVGDGFLTADRAPCSQGEKCDYTAPNGCSYYRMLYDAADRRQVVTNYAYGVRIFQAPALRGFGRRNPFHRDLLVCDEGDLAEGAVVEANSLTFTHDTWQRHGAPFGSDDVATWANWAGPLSERLADTMAGIGLPASGSQAKRLATLRWMVDLLQRLGAVVAWAEEWIVVSQPTGVAIRPIWGWTVAKWSLWGWFPRVLLMSATLGDPNVLLRKLGMDPEQSTYIEVPSTFPAPNRPVFYWPLVSVSRKSTEEDWDRLAKGIKYLADQPGLRNKKGIVHTASFPVARELHSRLVALDDRFMTHTPAAQVGGMTLANALLVFQYAAQPLVIISPSMTHGIDLPYVVGWQVIAKVAWADLGDPVVKARRNFKLGKDPFGRRSYDNDAMSTIVQAAGRAVRTPTDRGVTYVLDQNFWPLYRRAYSPQSFRDAVRWLKASS